MTSPSPSSPNVRELLAHPALIVLALFCCCPGGLALVWTHPRWTVKQKSIWTGGFFVGFLVLGILGQLAPKRDNGGAAPVVGTKPDQSSQEFESLAEGRVPSNTLLDYLKRIENLELHGPKNGTEAAGTPFQFLNDLVGERCRIYVGGREQFAQRVSAIIVEGQDKDVVALVLATPLDLTQPTRRGNDVTSLNSFIQTVLPKANLKQTFKDQSATLAAGGQAKEVYGKASMAVDFDKSKKELRVTITVAR